LEVLDPADQRIVVGTVPAMSAAEVTELYDVAERGFRVWRATSAIARGLVMARAAALLRERSPMIVSDLVAEMGKSSAEAEVEVTKSADFFDYYAGLARLPQGRLLADARPQTHVHTRPRTAGHRVPHHTVERPSADTGEKAGSGSAGGKRSTAQAVDRDPDRRRPPGQGT
jgi:aldehyde dehydrogenase (NAD+)